MICNLRPWILSNKISFRLEIIKYSHSRKSPSQLPLFLHMTYCGYVFQSIAVLVHYEQSESMHDVWCLLCIFPRLFLLGRSRWCWRYYPCKAHRTNIPFSPMYERYQSEKSPLCRSGRHSGQKCLLHNIWQSFVHMQRIRHVWWERRSQWGVQQSKG